MEAMPVGLPWQTQMEDVHLHDHCQQSAASSWVWGQNRYFTLVRKSRRKLDRRRSAEHRHCEANWLIDDQVRRNCEFCLFVDVSFSSVSNERPRAACRLLKADVLCKSKKTGMVPGKWDQRSKLAAVGHRARTARQSSTWERGKIGGRRRIDSEKTKTITIFDTRIQIHTSTGRRVEVKSTFGGRPRVNDVSTYM